MPEDETTNQLPQTDAFIQTEGKTDQMHLKKAKEKLNIQMRLSFHDKDECIGSHNLLAHCKALSRSPYRQERPLIFIFDHDNQQIFKEVMDNNKRYKDWGNNLYSFAIPIPKHRQGYENISIEFYYNDSEIKTLDIHDKRLFLSSEFTEISGRHKEDVHINYGNRYKLKNITDYKKAKILDSDIFDQKHCNVALSKSSFAENILNDISPFNNFSFESFSEIFDVIKLIIKKSEIVKEPSDDVRIDTQKIDVRDWVHRDNPPVLSIFVGREKEIEMLLDPKIRVAAITGLGGEGKSSLAARIYEKAKYSETITKYYNYGWCDCKDLETPFHR